MMNARLSVNLAKFDREGNLNNREERKYQERRFKSHQSNQYGNNGELKYKGDRPYLNAVLRNNRIHQHIQDVTVPDDADYDVVQWYDKSVLGKTKDLVELRGLHQSLTREGLTDLKLKYLGRLNVLLTFKKYEEANDFVDKKQKWSKIFSQLEVFDPIATSIGKVVASSHVSFSDGSLTRDTVGVIVDKGGKIQRETNLKWRDKCYKIWCREDDDVWCPDWSSKETKTSAEVEIPPTGVGLGRPEENGTTADVRSAPNSNQEFNKHGEGQTSCMGTGENNNKETPSNGIKVEDMEIQTENGGKEIHGGYEENKELEEEIKATIEIGQMLGVDRW
ncbi:hypothetical protein L1987_34715 [Smallanthus sonchifolius]|uniref:Uncharacterized protein n=1 Tax=Smallanthus sonchifolius TaxID=185202 RepID=A0ACB9HUA4_9ASTR|nr:hypothetical protein L1987_34715 [Smallanthus sonchifolius]